MLDIPLLKRISSWPNFAPKVVEEGNNRSFQMPAAAATTAEAETNITSAGGRECKGKKETSNVDLIMSTNNASTESGKSVMFSSEQLSPDPWNEDDGKGNDASNGSENKDEDSNQSAVAVAGTRTPCYEYHTVIFEPSGPLGIKLEPATTNAASDGRGSGCRVMDITSQATISRRVADMNLIQPGDLIVNINGCKVKSWKYADIVPLLTKQGSEERIITFRRSVGGGGGGGGQPMPSPRPCPSREVQMATFSPFDTSVSMILSPTTQDGANEDGVVHVEGENEDEFIHSFEEEELAAEAANLSAKSLPEDMLSRPRFSSDTAKVVRLVHSLEEEEEEDDDDGDNEDISHSRFAANLLSLGSTQDQLEVDDRVEVNVGVSMEETRQRLSDAFITQDGTTTMTFANCDTLTLADDEAEASAPPRLQESDDLSSIGDDGMSVASEDSFVHLMRYCRCISSIEEVPETETKEEAEEIVYGSCNGASAEDGETNVSKVTMTGNKNKQRSTCRDALDIMSVSEEEDGRKKKNFTSLDVFGILFSSCFSCGSGK